MKTMMEFLTNNWAIILALVVILVVIVINLTTFASLPTEKQLAKVREWLLWAVVQAEAELGGGTGRLKLRSVYDLFLQRFPQLAFLISFERFSKLVDDALEEMRELLEQNEAVKALVAGEKE